MKLTPHHLARFLELRATGLSAIRAARLVGFHRNTLARKLQDDPHLAWASGVAQEAGKQIQEENRMAVTTTATTPAEELTALSLQRAHEALDVEEGKPGAAGRLTAIEDRIREVNTQVERAALVESERGRRAAEAQERERVRQRQDAQARKKKFAADKQRGFTKIEQAATQALVPAILETQLAAAGEQAADVELRRLDGDERMAPPDGTESAITDRLTYLLNRKAGLSDIQTSASYGLGEKPLGTTQ